jgi:NADPH-dependent glutamate synthase beta subunit-like oxidoreductase
MVPQQGRMGRDGEIAALIVWVIAEGRKMSAGIDKYLQAGKSAKQSVK